MCLEINALLNNKHILKDRFIQVLFLTLNDNCKNLNLTFKKYSTKRIYKLLKTLSLLFIELCPNPTERVSMLDQQEHKSSPVAYTYCSRYLFSSWMTVSESSSPYDRNLRPGRAQVQCYVLWRHSAAVGLLPSARARRVKATVRRTPLVLRGGGLSECWLMIVVRITRGPTWLRSISY